jgi:hypothetical protein
MLIIKLLTIGLGSHIITTGGYADVFPITRPPRLVLPPTTIKHQSEQGVCIILILYVLIHRSYFFRG